MTEPSMHKPCPQPESTHPRHGTTFDPAPYREAIKLVQIHGADHILREHTFRGDEWIADIGCGEGLVLRDRLLPLIPRGRVIGVDISAPMLEAARNTITDPRVHFVRALGEALPLGERSVDVVFSNFALHWMNTPERMAGALRGAAEALKPGGVMLAYFSRAGTFAELFETAAAVGARPEWRHLFDGGAFRHPVLPPGDGIREEVRAAGLTLHSVEYVNRWLPLPSAADLTFWFRTCARPFMDRLHTPAAQQLFAEQVVETYEALGARVPEITRGGGLSIRDRAIALTARRE